MRLIASLVIIALTLTGCGAKREEVHHREEQRHLVQTETTKTERSTFAPNGTPFVEVTITTRVLDEKTRAEADAQISSTTTLQAPELAAGARVVIGAAGAAVGGGALSNLLNWLTSPEGAGTGVAVAGVATLASKRYLGHSRRAGEADELEERVTALEEERGSFRDALAAVVKGNALFMELHPDQAAALKDCQRRSQADTEIKSRVKEAQA